MSKELIEKIKSDISFWDREYERCKKNHENPEHSAYYLGLVDGLKEGLSYLETGRSVSSHEIEQQIKNGLTHGKVKA